MADDGKEAARLVVTLEARLDKFQKTLDKAVGSTDTTMTRIAGRIKSGAGEIDRVRTRAGHSIAADLSEADKASQLTRSQMMELAHVTRSVFDGLAAGANPFRLMAMEGGRVAQALGSGPGGVGGALGAIAGMFNPVVAGVVALVAVMGLGVKAASDYENSHNRLLQMMYGLGRGALVTVDDIEALAAANAQAGHATVGASEEFAQAFIHIHGMSRENLGAAIGIVNDFSKATGVDAKHGLADLAKALDDPKQGVIDLNREISAFTQADVRAIQAMAESGDKAGALKLMLDRVKEATAGASTELTGFGKVLKGIAEGFSEAWKNAGKFFDGLVHAQTDQAKLARLKEDLYMSNYGADDATRADIQRQITALEAKIKGSPQAKAAKDKDDQQFADETGISSGMARERKNLQSQLQRLNAALKGDHHGATDQEISEQIGFIQHRLERLDRREGIKKPKEISDTTDTFDKSATSAEDAAHTERLKAEAALSDNIREHARLEKVAINAELDKQRDDLDARRKAIESATGDAHKKSQLAALAKADADIDAAQAAKEAAVDAKLNEQLEAQGLARAKQIADGQKSLLSVQLSSAKTRSERLKIELQLLDLEKKELDDKLSADRKAALKQDPANAANINAGFDVLQGTSNQLFAARRNQAQANNASPLAAWAAEGKQSAEQVGDALQAAAVKGIDDFNAGLADAIVNGKSLGQTMSSILKQMEADLVRYLLKQAELNLFGAGDNSAGVAQVASSAIKLAGFASGGSPPTGTPYLVGENGPEIRVDKVPGQIVPNHLLGSFAAAPRAGNVSVNQTVHINAANSILSDEVWQKIENSKQEAIRSAVPAAVAMSRKLVPADMARSNMSRFR